MIPTAPSPGAVAMAAMVSIAGVPGTGRGVERGGGGAGATRAARHERLRGPVR